LISQGFQRISVPFAFAPRHRNRAKAWFHCDFKRFQRRVV
jgi:hypothetical protein